MTNARYPMLYQINTRVRLTELERNLGRATTLDDISGFEVDQLASMGFDWIWLLGIWQTGPAGRRISLMHPDLQREYRETLPDFEESDVVGSCFAVRSYTAHIDFGGDEALARFRDRLHRRGLRLMLDFVPNHTAPDHPWIEQHPDYYVHGNEEQLEAAPHNYTRVMTKNGPLILAYGRDPYIPGWSDTLQLNYGNAALQAAMIGELEEVASRCDGVRCDMAMLVLPQIFKRTWGIAVEPFWPRATEQVRKRYSGFIFTAEAYWDLEWALQQQGFDYAYDKRLYDRLRESQARPVRDHLRADLDYQDRLVRFLENHDEPRAAAVFLPEEIHRAAAVATFLSPGMRFFHQGQLEGRKIRIPVQLRRGPAEPDDPETSDFYRRLIQCLQNPVFRDGDWRMLECRPAWDGNWTWDCFIAFAWEHSGGRRMAAVNYADHPSQCYVPMLYEDLAQGSWMLRDLMGEACYIRDGAVLTSPGLYLDLPEWGYHIFEITREK